MKIASWNINGIAAHRRELIKFLTDVKPDVMCIQEIRGQIVLSTPGYHSFWFSAAEPNFSGTLVLSKREPLSVKLGIGIKKYDREGRAITAEYKDFYVVNVYVPNYQAQSPPERRKFRLNWDTAFRTYISKLPKPVVICGDFNVTYTDKDIYPSEARSSTVPPDMITEERKNFERLLDVGFKDVFRTFYPEKRDAYTWWAQKNQNRIHNKGSRLDYFLVSNELLTYDNATYPDIRPGESAWYTFNRPLHGTSPETARPFVPVQGAHDMYRAGEYMVWTDGSIQRCKEDTNFSPEDYPQAWETDTTEQRESGGEAE